MANETRQVKNLPVLYDMVGDVQRFIKNFRDLEVERVLTAEKILRMRIDEIRSISVEQEITFRDVRYIVTRVEENKDSNGIKYTELEAFSAFIELGNYVKEGKFLVLAQTVSSTLNKLLMLTGWSVGTIETLEGGDPLISVDETNYSVLALLDVITKITDYEVEFDTVKKLVNLRKQVGKDTNEIIRYRNNLKSIKRTVEPPIATAIHPVGRDGLTIESVNGGVRYIEDYSYYTDTLGIPIGVAKTKFRKDYLFSDERFIIAANLKSKAISELARLSKPIIRYQTTVESLNTDSISEGDYLYVIDEDLDIRQRMRVVRIVDKLFREYENEIELGSLQDDLGSIQDNTGSGSESGKLEMVVAENGETVNLVEAFVDVLSVSVSTYSSSDLLADVNMVLHSTNSALVEFYVEVGGERATPTYKQSVGVDSYNTLSITTPLLQVQDGTRFVRVMARASALGVSIVAPRELQLIVSGTSVIGGQGNPEPPGAIVIEETDYDKLFSIVKDGVVNDMKRPSTTNVQDDSGFSDISSIVQDSVDVKLEGDDS